MSLRVTTFINGRWRQNCYILAHETGDAIVIDPGSQPQEIIAMIEEQGGRVLGILNTHANFDHVGAVAPLMERYQAPFYLHRGDEALLKRANLYRVLFEARDTVKIPEITTDIARLPEAFEMGPFRISWIGSPGHTEGSVCLCIDGFLFSGDTLMQNAIGRTDLPGGNREKLLESVRRLGALPPHTVVCGGHGPRTTIEAEFAPGSRVWSLIQ